MSKHETWQFAGSAPETYQRALVPAIFAPWVAQVVDLANPRQGDRILDVACGTGVVARAAASRIGSDGAVTGAALLVDAAKDDRHAPPAAGRTLRGRRAGAGAHASPRSSACCAARMSPCSIAQSDLNHSVKLLDREYLIERGANRERRTEQIQANGGGV